MKLFDRFSENLKKDKNRIIYSDYRGDYTSSYVEDMSGRVYNYLLKNNFGKEDVIAIYLPHSVDIILCELRNMEMRCGYFGHRLMDVKRRYRIFYKRCKCKISN